MSRCRGGPRSSPDDASIWGVRTVDEQERKTEREPLALTPDDAARDVPGTHFPRDAHPLEM